MILRSENHNSPTKINKSPLNFKNAQSRLNQSVNLGSNTLDNIDNFTSIDDNILFSDASVLSRSNE